MIYLLLLLLLLLLLFLFIVIGNDILSPSIAVTLTFLLSVSFIIINLDTWNIIIHGKTVIVIIAGIVAMFFGELLVRICFNLKYKGISQKIKLDIKDKKNVVTPSRSLTNILIIYMLFILMWFFYHVYTTASLLPDSGKTFIGEYRSTESSMNPLLKFGIASSLAIAYFYLYAFLDNYINSGKKMIRYAIPVLLYALTSILGSGRMNVLYLIVSALAMSYYLYKRKNGWKNTFNLKILRVSITSVLFFFGIFYLLGMLTGKSNVNSFFNIISHYAGSSIVALDYYLIDYKYSIENFGSETLVGLTNLFRLIGIDLNITDTRILGFVHVGSMPHSTNIYTGFRRLLNDYGYIGMILIQYIIGIVYTWIYLKSKHKVTGNVSFGIVLYVFLFRYLAFQVIDERIIVNVLTTTTIIQIFIIWLLFNHVSKAKKINEQESLNPLKNTFMN